MYWSYQRDISLSCVYILLLLLSPLHTHLQSHPKNKNQKIRNTTTCRVVKRLLLTEMFKDWLPSCNILIYMIINDPVYLYKTVLGEALVALTINGIFWCWVTIDTTLKTVCSTLTRLQIQGDNMLLPFWCRLWLWDPSLWRLLFWMVPVLGIVFSEISDSDIYCQLDMSLGGIHNITFCSGISAYTTIIIQLIYGKS